MVKADSDKYKNMLKEVRKLCEKLNDIIDDDIVIRILTKCQESVIVIGESLEKIERANEKEVLKKLQTVNKLEQLCELMYQYSQKMERNIRKEIIRIIDNIICDIDTIPRTYGENLLQVMNVKHLLFLFRILKLIERPINGTPVMRGINIQIMFQ